MHAYEYVLTNIQTYRKKSSYELTRSSDYSFRLTQEKQHSDNKTNIHKKKVQKHFHSITQAYHHKRLRHIIRICKRRAHLACVCRLKASFREDAKNHKFKKFLI